ncbi:hypothetical protein GCM10026915_28410 [Simiduia litorea]
MAMYKSPIKVSPVGATSNNDAVATLPKVTPPRLIRKKTNQN